MNHFLKIIILSLAFVFGVTAHAQAERSESELRKNVSRANQYSLELREKAALCTDSPERLYKNLNTPIEKTLSQIWQLLENGQSACEDSAMAATLAQNLENAGRSLQKQLNDLNNNEGNILWGLDGGKPSKYPNCRLKSDQDGNPLFPGNINSTESTYSYIALKKKVFCQGLKKSVGLESDTTEIDNDCTINWLFEHARNLKAGLCK